MKKILLSLCACGVIFMGCNGESEAKMNPWDMLKSKESWNIISLKGGKDGMQKSVLFGDNADSKYNIAFKESEFSGTFGCNGVFGSYKVTGDILEFSNAGATKKMCPPEVMENEEKLLQGILNQKTKVIINKDSTISLSAENFEVILK